MALAVWSALPAAGVETYSPCAKPGENPAIMAVNNSISLAFLNANMDYIEPSDSGALPVTNYSPGNGANYLDYEEGSLNGARLSVSWMSPTYADLYVQAQWDGATGQANYTGFDTNNNPVTGISGATIQDYQLKLGKGIVTGEKWMLTPYASFGGRHWTRVIGEGTSGDYNETYQHFYLGVGSLVQYAATDAWVITGEAMVGRTFYAWINDAPDGLDHAPLGAAPILKLGLEADARAGERLHLFAGFDYTYFTYGQSDVYLVPNSNPQEVVLEPISRTQMFDVTLGARFSYF